MKELNLSAAILLGPQQIPEKTMNSKIIKLSVFILNYELNAQQHLV